jgi:hypothetical protein
MSTTLTRRCVEAVRATAAQRRPGKIASSIGLAAALGLMLAGCTNPGARAIDAGVPLTAAPDLTGAATPGVTVWRSPGIQSGQAEASAYLIPPATVYRGRGSYYADLNPQQVDDIASKITQDVRTEVARHFKVVNTGGPGVSSINLVLVRVVPPRPDYVSSGPTSNVTGSALAVGMPESGGTTAGTMIVAGKFIDTQTGSLVVAFSAPVSPTVMDLPTPGQSGRAFDFAGVASQQFATDLVRAMIRQRQNSGAAVK